MSTRGFDTMDALFEWKHSQYSPIMASQCFHCWLCMPKRKSIVSSKILTFFLFSIQQTTNYMIYMSLALMDVTCINVHWLYLNPPSFIYNAFSFLQDYMARHCHFLMFEACEKNMENPSTIHHPQPNIRVGML